MHEIGLCQSVVDAVEQRARGRPVDAVTVRVGTLLRVVPDAFTQAFQLVAAGGVADGVTPDLVLVAARGRCQDCGGMFESDEPIPACPSCGGVRVAREGGDELILESIRYRRSPHVEP